MLKPQLSVITPLLCLAGNILFSNMALADDHHNNHLHNGYYEGSPLFGGMAANQILTNMALESDAMREPEPMQYGDHPDHRSLIERQQHPYQQTVSSRLAELDQLATSGAITPQEYKNRRLGIVAGL